MAGNWQSNGSAKDIYVNKTPAQFATYFAAARSKTRQHIPRQQFQIRHVVQSHPLQYETLNTRLAR